MDKEQVIKDYARYVVGSYTKSGIVFVKGRGSYLWDTEGKRYLDFFPGWAVSGLGHCHPAITGAISNQAEVLIHLANNHYHPWQGLLAKRLIGHSFPGKVFFCNSGAESNEAAIKLARLYGAKTGRYKIISMDNSFHGRTMATVTMTGQPKYNELFRPLPEGFSHVPFNNFERLLSAIDDKTVGVILEPIQGEGGINVADRGYMEKLHSLSMEKDLLLIFDEVQTGFGRTGEMFGYQHFGVVPHIMTLAKTLGGGFPVGAMIARPDIADLMVPGTHAATFGGSPLACASCLAVLDAIENEHLLQNVSEMGVYLRQKLEALGQKYPSIERVKGMGVMLGLEMAAESSSVANKCMKEGLLINCTHGNVLRFMPALNVSSEEIDAGIDIFERVLKTLH